MCMYYLFIFLVLLMRNLLSEMEDWELKTIILSSSCASQLNWCHCLSLHSTGNCLHRPPTSSPRDERERLEMNRVGYSARILGAYTDFLSSRQIPISLVCCSSQWPKTTKFHGLSSWNQSFFSSESSPLLSWMQNWRETSSPIGWTSCLSSPGLAAEKER